MTTMKTVNKLSPIKSLLSVFILFSLIACQGESAAEIQIDENKYQVLGSPMSISTGDKIEVAELFWYGCGHCFALEPALNQWKESMPKNAEFVKVPAIFSARWVFHGQAYYTMKTLGVLDQANTAFFYHIHTDRKAMTNLTHLVEFLAQYDKSEKEVTDAFNSFAVDSMVRNAKKFTRESAARSVPTIIVDGKYLTNSTMTGGNEELFKTVDLLIKKAASER